jgi:hypothetical protein
VLVHGNELLGGLISGYDMTKDRGQSDHTVANIVSVLEQLFPTEKERRIAAFHMVGYLLFDAFVGNTDRHHQNWGIVLELETEKRLLTLAPTFDHGFILGT